MDVVYFTRAQQGTMLLHSMRTLVNIPHEKVWFAGYLPPWADKVGHVRCPDHLTKFENTRMAMETVCRDQRVSEDFILFNDDFFVMEPVDTVPTLHRGTIQYHLGKTIRKLEENPRTVVSDHRRGGLDTLRWLTAYGCPEPLSYEVHTPMVVNRERMLDTLERTRSVLPSFQRSLYGNLHSIGGTQIEDVKVDGNKPVPEGPFISVDHVSWLLRVSRYVNARFPEPGPYEKRGALP